jgi:hypothetical protein
MPAFDGKNHEEAGMQFASIVVAAGIGLGCCALADAGSRSGEARADRIEAEWTEAQSLRELPAGVQALLGVGLGEEGGIADRGDRFNASDVTGGGLPQRRFALGAVNGDTAVVAVEQGGRGYQVQTMEFRQVGATWEPVRCTLGIAPPRRSAELLENIAARKAAAPGACQLPGFHPEPATATATTAVSAPAVQTRLKPRPGA